VRWVRETHEIFSHEEFGVPGGAMNVFMPPVTVDPPHHARYRAVLNPAFTPGAARALIGDARDIAGDLIDGFRPSGRCDFVREFPRVMPVLVFLKVLGLPPERRDEFVRWAVDYTSAGDQKTKDDAAAAVAEFLTGELEARYLEPRDDLLSRIGAWRRIAASETKARSSVWRWSRLSAD
jgi:cytochrome P450